METITAGDWKTQFAQAQLTQGKSKNTLDAYLSDLKAFVEWFLLTNGEAFRPELLNNFDLRAFRTASLEAYRVSPATWNRRRASLRVFCEWSRVQGWVSYDVMDGVLGVEAEELAPHWLEKNEFARLMRQLEINLNAANTQGRRDRAVRDAALVAVMVFGGLRESEAAALLAMDVTLSERAGKLSVRLSKGEKSREVPLNSEARRWLGAWLAILKPENGVTPVFEISTRMIQDRVADLGKEAGISELTPHRLRHTCAKRMIDGGAQLTAVQKILGHAKLETTARYTMAGWEDLESAVEGGISGRANGRTGNR